MDGPPPPPPPPWLATAGWDELLAGGPLLGPTHALLLVVDGQVRAEAYGPDVGPEATLRSWSMAKSVLHAAVGALVQDGRLRLDEALARPEWSDDDPRTAITVEQALRMCAGLAWAEDYAPGARGSDVQAMLFGSGREDVAAYAAAKPLTGTPGVTYCYASGTSNLVSWRVGQAVPEGPGGVASWLRQRLLGPAGMTSALPRLDGAGTWIASSYLFCTARDFARFGRLYLDDGVVGGQRLLPEGWVDHARTLTAASVAAGDRHGAHWWLHDRRDGGRFPQAFAAHGYGTQRIVVVPELDAVLVRCGDTPERDDDAGVEAVDRCLDGVLAALAERR